MELLVVSGLIDSFINASRQYYSEACSAVLNMYDGAFGKNCYRILVVYYFCKALHPRCLTEFRIRLNYYLVLTDSEIGFRTVFLKFFLKLFFLKVFPQIVSESTRTICDALRDLVPSVPFQKT